MKPASVEKYLEHHAPFWTRIFVFSRISADAR